MNSSYIKALIWAILIFIGSSLTGDSLSEVKLINIPGFDKFVHFTWYFFLYLFLAAGIFKHKGSIGLLTILLLVLICISYGGLLEILQGTLFAKRSQDLFDFIANSSGVITGSVTFSWLYNRKFWKKWL